MAFEFRNIGLGVMGYANMLMMLGIKYGEDKAISLTDTIFRYMFRLAVFESNQLAKERGKFPGYRKALFNSRIIREHFTKDEIKMLKVDGLRNCSLLSVAPTGSN